MASTSRYLRQSSPREKASTPPSKWGLPIGQQRYDQLHKAMERQRNMEYNDLLRKKRYEEGGQHSLKDFQPLNTSFYLGDDSKHEAKRRILEKQRNQEYRELVSKKEPPRSKSIDIPTDVDSGLPIGQQHYKVWRNFLRDQRNREYNALQDEMKMKENPRRTNAPQASGPYDGIFHGLGDHGNVQEHLAEERKLDLKQHMEKENRAHGVPSRPDWALGVGEDRERHRASPARNYDQGFNRPPPRDGPVGYGPSDDYRGGGQGGAPPRAQGGGFRTPNYDEMLNSKRREEAQRRRHDDPEYQMRLTSLDSRDQDQDRDRMRDVQQRQQPMRGY